MFQSKSKAQNLRSALLLGAASAAAVSLSVPARADDTSVETVVVTGSRIPQQGLYASSPVTAVGQQELKFEGTTNVENLINNLPSAFADYTNTQSNGAVGTATVDLRGLGNVRTLVLVDGKRLMPADPAVPVADLNNIPAALVDHVEVLTGGASAVYGSDAEAGVVNFIMRKDFEGVEFDGQYSVNNTDNDSGFYHDVITPFIGTPGFAYAPKNYWGGGIADGTLLMGTNTADGKGNITAYLSYRNIQPVLQGSYDYSACTLAVSRGDAQVCAGSANKNSWLSIDNYNAYLGDPSIPYFFYQEGSGVANSGTGTFTPFTGAGNQRFNFGAPNYLQRPDTRYTGGFFGHYEVNPQLDIYTSFMLADDHTVAQIAPSGLFIGTGAHSGYVEVNCDNPIMTADENAALCGTLGDGTYTSGNADGRFNGSGNITPGQALIGIGRRDIEGGNREDDLRHTSYRMVIGAKGDLGDGWAYDVYAQYGTTVYSESYSNEFSVSRSQNALQVSPETGNCVAFDVGTDLNCVPLDIFNGLGSITPQALAYVSAQGLKEGSTEEQVVSGSLTGDLGAWGIQSPGAKSPVSLALGAEYRAEYIELRTSRDFQLNDLYGQGSATLPVPKSGFNVVEGFGEIRVPLIQDHPFFEDLTLNAGYRYSSYSTAGAVSSYKYGGEWQPVDDFRLRGSFQRAVRAPNVLELFSPANVILFGGSDPCAGPTDTTVILNCEAHGVPGNYPVPDPDPADYNGTIACPAAQCKEQVAGNISLKPEQSDTKSFGIVLTPSFIPGFTATIDYFDIVVNDYITAIDPNTTLAACYGAAATTASQAIACPLVEPFRNPLTHSIVGTGFVSSQTVNAKSLSTRGWDMEANYQTGLADWGLGENGEIAVNFLGTITETLVTQPYTGFFDYDCAGRFGVVCGTPTPKWRHKVRVTWSSPWDFDLSVSWRHLAGVDLDLNTDNPLLNGSCGASGYPCPDTTDAHIKAFDYFDLAGNWTVRPGVELRAGVTNIFDKNPPTVDTNNYGISSPPFGSANTYPGVYDALGRTIFVGGTIKY